MVEGLGLAGLQRHEDRCATGGLDGVPGLLELDLLDALVRDGEGDGLSLQACRGHEAPFQVDGAGVSGLRRVAGHAGLDHVEGHGQPTGAVPVLRGLARHLDDDDRRVVLTLGEPRLGEGVPELLLLRGVVDDVGRTGEGQPRARPGVGHVDAGPAGEVAHRLRAVAGDEPDVAVELRLLRGHRRRVKAAVVGGGDEHAGPDVLHDRLDGLQRLRVGRRARRLVGGMRVSSHTGSRTRRSAPQPGPIQGKSAGGSHVFFTIRCQ